MNLVKEAQTFFEQVKFLVLPSRTPQKFTAADTTPAVLNNEHWICNNTGAVTVTNFLSGSTGQILYILGDGFTTVANNANIKTNTGANKLMAANKVYTFHSFNNVWYEHA